MKHRKHDYDLERYLIESDRDWEIVFGKFSATLLSVAIKEDPRYFHWMISENFPILVVDIICDMLDFMEGTTTLN